MFLFLDNEWGRLLRALVCKFEALLCFLIIIFFIFILKILLKTMICKVLIV